MNVCVRVKYFPVCACVRACVRVKSDLCQI